MQPQYELQAAKGLHKMFLKIEEEYGASIKCLKFFATLNGPSKDTNIYFYPKASVAYKVKVKFNAFFDGIISYPHPWEMLAIYDNLKLWLLKQATIEAAELHSALDKHVVTTLIKGSNYNAYNSKGGGKDLIIEWDNKALSSILRALYLYTIALEQGQPQPCPVTKPKSMPIVKPDTKMILKGLLNIIEHMDVLDSPEKITAIHFDHQGLEYQDKYHSAQGDDRIRDVFAKPTNPWGIFITLDNMKAFLGIRTPMTNRYMGEDNLKLFITDTKDYNDCSDAWVTYHGIIENYLRTINEYEDKTMTQTIAPPLTGIDKDGWAPACKELNAYVLKGLYQYLTHARTNNRKYHTIQFDATEVLGVGLDIVDQSKRGSNWDENKKPSYTSNDGIYHTVKQYLERHQPEVFTFDAKYRKISVENKAIAQGMWNDTIRNLEKHISQDVTESQQVDNNKINEGSSSLRDKPCVNPNNREYHYIQSMCRTTKQILQLQHLRVQGYTIERLYKAMGFQKLAPSKPIFIPNPTPSIDLSPGAINYVQEDKYKDISIHEIWTNAIKEYKDKHNKKKKENEMESLISNLTNKVKNLSQETITKIAAVALFLLVIGKYSLVKKLVKDVKTNIQNSDSYKEIVKDGTSVVANAKKLVGIKEGDKV